MRKCTILVLLCLSVAVLSFVVGCTTPQRPSSVPPTPKSPTPVLVPQSRNLVNATITVGPGKHYDIPFSVDVNVMRDVRVVGSFRASGGSGNDIKAIIMDDMAYINWVNGHQVSVLYSSGQITAANINTAIIISGKYHLVFSNGFSTFSSKSVSTRVDLEWTELRYQ